jgi:predicted O-methyltransferase YrrM
VLVVGASETPAVLALARTLGAGGAMICIEPDREAAARAAAAFAREGLRHAVSVMIGDPALFIRKVAGPFDLIVIEVGSEGARERVESHLPRLLAPGGAVRR